MLFCLVAFYFFSLLISFESYCFWKSSLSESEAKAGDVYFLPSGRVHSLGEGTFVAEIQETSDITYRIYDFGRVDAQGKPRLFQTKC